MDSPLEHAHAETVIGAARNAEFDGAGLPVLIDGVKRAREILYLGDNACEIVFDRLLIERLPRPKVAFAVEGSPIINDATIEDAETVGLTNLGNVVTNGSDGPGKILESYSSAFKERFDRADLVLAKGQANYESLSHADKEMFSILRAKCPVIARVLDCKAGQMILRRSKASGEVGLTEDEETIHAEP